MVKSDALLLFIGNCIAADPGKWGIMLTSKHGKKGVQQKFIDLLTMHVNPLANGKSTSPETRGLDACADEAKRRTARENSGRSAANGSVPEFYSVWCDLEDIRKNSRLNSPLETQGMTIMAVAGVGILINGATAMLFMHGRSTDLNVRGAFIHMAADALVSAGVLIAGALSLWFGWSLLDPIASLLIAAVILISTWSLFQESLHLLFDGVPKQVELRKVRSFLESLEGVTNVHDLHIWAMSTSQIAMTVHLVMPKGSSGDHFLEDIAHELHHRFEIVHPTIQIELNQVEHGCH